MAHEKYERLSLRIKQVDMAKLRKLYPKLDTTVGIIRTLISDKLTPKTEMDGLDFFEKIKSTKKY